MPHHFSAEISCRSPHFEQIKPPLHGRRVDDGHVGSLSVAHETSRHIVQFPGERRVVGTVNPQVRSVFKGVDEIRVLGCRFFFRYARLIVEYRHLGLGRGSHALRHPDADRHADAWRSDCERADANTQDVGNSIKKPQIALR